MTSVTKVEPWLEGPDLAAAGALKDEGGALFKIGYPEAADAKYAAAIGALSAAETAWPAAEELVLTCHSNRAMCLLKLGQPAAALAQCEAGLASRSAVRAQAVLARAANSGALGGPPRPLALSIP
jgi:hypothetical protein